MQKKLLLFGGTGFVGSMVAQRALSRGFNVVVATRSGAPPLDSPMDVLLRRVRAIGGQAAGRESFGELPTSTSSSSAAAAAAARTSATSSSGSGSGSDHTQQRPSASQLERRVHEAGERAALEFVSIDACSRDQVFHFLHDHPDATAVVNAVGLLTRDYEDARQINGDVMANIAAGVYHPKLVPLVRKVVYVSAEPYHLYSRRVLGSRRLLKGYFHGKRIGEKAVLENLGVRGAVLRPSFIYGTRHVLFSSAASPDAVSTLSLPLSWVGYPLDRLLTAVGGGKLLMPPVSVDVVSEAAVRACAWADAPDHDVHGICDVYRMHEICSAVEPAQPDVRA